jgi:hypothetical protein
MHIAFSFSLCQMATANFSLATVMRQVKARLKVCHACDDGLDRKDIGAGNQERSRRR